MQSLQSCVNQKNPINQCRNFSFGSPGSTSISKMFGNGEVIGDRGLWILEVYTFIIYMCDVCVLVVCRCRSKTETRVVGQFTGTPR